MPKTRYVRTAASTAWLLLAVAVFAAAGCSDKKNEDRFEVEARGMVPLGSGAAVTDSTGVDSFAVDPAGGTAGSDLPAVLKATGVETPPAGRAPVAAKDAPPAGTFNLQLGSFLSADNANALAGRVRALGQTPHVEVATLGGQTYHRVVLRGLSDRNKAERLGESLRGKLGITYLIRQN